MSSTEAPENETSAQNQPERKLTAAARRALAEAEARRAARDAAATDQPKELGGKDGPDPARYGDWENGGIASDF